MMKTDLSQFVSEMLDSLQLDSTKCALQYEVNNFVTMATYWAQTSPILNAFLATFGLPFTHLLMVHVPHMHDPASIYMYIC